MSMIAKCRNGTTDASPDNDQLDAHSRENSKFECAPSANNVKIFMLGTEVVQLRVADFTTSAFSGEDLNQWTERNCIFNYLQPSSSCRINVTHVSYSKADSFEVCMDKQKGR